MRSSRARSNSSTAIDSHLSLAACDGGHYFDRTLVIDRGATPICPSDDLTVNRDGDAARFNAEAPYEVIDHLL
jgi:hypothetical protein